jgi:hypothetical protein
LSISQAGLGDCVMYRSALTREESIRNYEKMRVAHHQII